MESAEIRGETEQGCENEEEIKHEDPMLAWQDVSQSSRYKKIYEHICREFVLFCFQNS